MNGDARADEQDWRERSQRDHERRVRNLNRYRDGGAPTAEDRALLERQRAALDLDAMARESQQDARRSMQMIAIALLVAVIGLALLVLPLLWFAVLGPEEACTGDPARRAGNEFLFQMMAYQNIQLLNNYEIKKIVTTCPHCFNTLKNEYPDRLKEHIRKFFRLWSINQWKRERFAPSFHLDDWNVDPQSWCRFPILSGGFQEELNELDKL